MNKNVFGHISAILAIVVWSLSSHSYSVLRGYLSPLEIILAGVLLSCAVLNLIYLPRLHLKRTTQEIGFILAGLFGVALWFYLEVRARALVSSESFYVVFALVPLCTLLAGKISGRRPFASGSFFAGVGFAVVGVLVLVFFGDGFSSSLVGLAFCLGCALALGAFFVSYKSVLHRGHIIAVCRRVLFWGFVFLIVLCFFMDFNIESYRAVLSLDMLPHLLIVGVAVPSVCYLAFGYAIKTLEPTRVSGYIYAAPVASILYSAVVHSHSVSSYVLVSVILIIIGITLTVKRR